MTYDPDAQRMVEELAKAAKKENEDRQVQSVLGRATLLGQPCNDPRHAELNGLLKERGWTDEQINHAHDVAAGRKPLSEACPSCEEQTLYYSQSIMIEGRRLIYCTNCEAQCVDRSEQAGVAMLTQEMIGKAMKGITGVNNAKRRKVLSRRPQG